MDFLTHLFDTSDFPPRWHCGNWSSGHGWLHILSDLGVWSAYVAIPCVLGFFLLRRRDLPFRKVFLLFAAFILACGSTHLMEALIFWWPAYRLAGLIKLFTAIVSWATVIALIPVVPMVLAMRSPEELEREVEARKRAELALQRANDELEQHISARTAELVRANEALRLERERFHTTLASIGDAVIATDAEGRVTFQNRVAEALTGWNEEGLGRDLVDVFQIVNEQTGKPVTSPVERVLREGMIVGLANHTVLISRDGTRRPIDDSGAPIRGADGNIVGVVLVFRDVSERQQVEAAMRQNEVRMRLAQQVAQIGTFDWNVQTGENTWTPELEAMYGLPPGGFTGTLGAWEKLVHPEDLPQASRQVEESLRHGTFAGEWRVIWPDGSVHWLAGRGSLFKDDEGRPLRLLGVNIDITDRKRMENELRQIAAELSETDRRKDEFLAILAHELRNPLAPLRNGLQVLRLASGDEAATARAREMMERQLAQMVRLVDDLLDVSRISRGKLELRQERTDLATIVNSAVETCGPALKEQGHALTVTLPDEPVPVDADRTRLSQALCNLLTNAAKYTERGGRVDLTVVRQGAEVVVSVKDNGIGIPAEMLPRVFDMFTQVDKSLEKSQGGLGIGLTIVQRLIEMHGGTVEARSDGPGQGSEFVVRLPVLAVPQPAPPPGRGGGVAARAPGRKVLVVDDNQDSAQSLAMMLKLMGNDVRLAHDGLEAIEAGDAFRPELILMDVGMPRMNGYDATRRIRELPWGESVVVVALTGWGQEEDRANSREAGCNSHLVKPVDLAALQKLLASLAE